MRHSTTLSLLKHGKLLTSMNFFFFWMHGFDWQAPQNSAQFQANGSSRYIQSSPSTRPRRWRKTLQGYQVGCIKSKVLAWCGRTAKWISMEVAEHGISFTTEIGLPCVRLCWLNYRLDFLNRDLARCRREKERQRLMRVWDNFGESIVGIKDWWSFHEFQMHGIGVGYVKDTHFSTVSSEGESHLTAYVCVSHSTNFIPLFLHALNRIYLCHNLVCRQRLGNMWCICVHR